MAHIFVFVKPKFLVAFMPCFGGFWFYFLNLFLNHEEDIAVSTWSSAKANETRVPIEKLPLNNWLQIIQDVSFMFHWKDLNTGSVLPEREDCRLMNEEHFLVFFLWWDHCLTWYGNRQVKLHFPVSLDGRQWMDGA